VNVGDRSNCLLGALAIIRQRRGKLKWRSGWARHGWSEFIGNPWGHFWVALNDGTTASYSAYDRNLPVWRQLWFRGYLNWRTPL